MHRFIMHVTCIHQLYFMNKFLADIFTCSTFVQKCSNFLIQFCEYHANDAPPPPIAELLTRMFSQIYYLTFINDNTGLAGAVYNYVQGISMMPVSAKGVD